MEINKGNKHHFFLATGKIKQNEPIKKKNLCSSFFFSRQKSLYDRPMMFEDPTAFFPLESVSNLLRYFLAVFHSSPVEGQISKQFHKLGELGHKSKRKLDPDFYLAFI